MLSAPICSLVHVNSQWSRSKPTRTKCPSQIRLPISRIVGRAIELTRYTLLKRSSMSGDIVLIVVARDISRISDGLSADDGAIRALNHIKG